MNETPRPCLLTTDCGAEMDDQWAIAHLAISPELDLCGVVTTHVGVHPTPVQPASEFTAGVSREVLQQVRRADVSVVAGSGVALASSTEPLVNPGVDFILEQASTYDEDNRLTVLAIGAITDVASALLVDPTLVQRIEVVAMAFNGWPAGTDPFNVKNDVKAWQVVMSSTVPLVVGPADACTTHLQATEKLAREVMGDGGGAGKYLIDVLIGWLQKRPGLCKAVTGNAGAWPVWDEIVTAYLLGMTRQERHVRPFVQEDTSFHHGPDASNTFEWITSVDEKALWKDFAQKIGR
jgi:purine nucleosidase